jgi:hypothetical protein
VISEDAFTVAEELVPITVLLATDELTLLELLLVKELSLSLPSSIFSFWDEIELSKNNTQTWLQKGYVTRDVNLL